MLYRERRVREYPADQRLTQEQTRQTVPRPTQDMQWMKERIEEAGSSPSKSIR
jgi:hypothetical protein